MNQDLNSVGRLISFLVLLASIVIIGALFYKVMIGFLVPVFLAAVLVVVFRPLHRWVLQKVGQQEYLAAGITTGLVIFSVLLPAALIISMAALQGTRLFANINDASISVGLNSARKKFGLESPWHEVYRSIQVSVDEIQKEVAMSTMAELSDPKGKLAGLGKKIQADLEELRLLRKLHDQQLASKDDAKKPKDAPSSEANSPHLEKLLASASDTNFDVTAEVWNSAIEKFRQATDSLLRAAGVPNQGNDRADLIELQAAALQFSSDWQQTKSSLIGGNSWRATLRELANPSPEQIRAATASTIGYLQPKLISLTGATAEFLIRLLVGTVIMIVSLYFFLFDGPRMVQSLMKLSPLDDRYEMELLTEFDRISRAIVLAMIFSAIVQGLTAGLGYYMAGVDSLIFLTSISILCGLIPFVGPSVVWVPVCIYLAVYEERYLAAGLLAIWGMVAVASIDNVVKAYVLHGQSQLHPLLALLSVLGGVQALGPIGLIVGPISVVLLQTLLSILQREILHIDQPGLSAAGTTGTGKSLSNWMSKLKRPHPASSHPASEVAAKPPPSSDPS
jgi:predicted PurR-regulated permease PerM